MKRDEISKQIEQNFREFNWEIADLRIQRDYSGWVVIVISSSFEGRSQEDRKKVVLKGMNEKEIEWLEVLTPDEREWAGSLPLNTDIDNLPLWPEALARGAQSEGASDKIVFPSDMDEDIEPPIVVNFYSLRGGVGRSTALAYTAKILAANRKKVVCVDMDIEAPGLTALFGKEKEIEEGQGLVNLLIALDRGEDPDISKHLLRITEEDDLYCLPAGRPDANYARLLRFIDPEAWYREEQNPLHKLINKLRTELPFKPDVILLDSRTGISQLSGPILFDLADISVIVFFPHPQALTGTKALVRALLMAKTMRQFTADSYFNPEPRFLVSPVPASKVPEIVRSYQNRSHDWIADWLQGTAERRNNIGIDVSEITHFVPYRESLATSDQILSDRDVWRDYEAVAEWIERFLPSPNEDTLSKTIPNNKNKVLSELSFSTGSAELQKDFIDTFVKTELFMKALDPKVPLILGRKGTGKTALFRSISEDKEKSAVVITSPAPLRGKQFWILSIDGFTSIPDILSSTNSDWRQFWTLYTCLSIHFSWITLAKPIPEPDSSFGTFLKQLPTSELDYIKLLQKLMSLPSAGLIAGDWLSKIDKIAPSSTMLLFDGLDTGFGISDQDRVRRRAALEGLFAFVTDKGDGFNNLRFKIVMREDIWRTLKFDNKSHFFGRSIALKWGDKASFFKVAIKQALRSETFKSLIATTMRRSITSNFDLELWDENDVFMAWNLLVGERMKGANTAFTRNWVWNRLADGNNDHSPRYLLQLMHRVTEWEIEENKKNIYDRSVIRPRGLMGVLQLVSGEALGALRDEEFPELKPLMEKLTTIGRTPLDANDLNVDMDIINLAREVGLLGVYEGSDENVERYKVPELFRHALNMTRKGQI